MTYVELVELIAATTGKFSLSYEGTGYLIEFIEAEDCTTVATGVIRSGGYIERRNETTLFVQL